MPASFDPLWERLVEGGVRRRPARRYLAELKDHLDDLVAEERRATSDPQDAEIRALTRLGSFEMLADAMIERGEFQSWSRKAPLATYLVAPVVALVAGTALAVVGVVMTAKGVHMGPAAAPPEWLRDMASGVAFSSHAVLPILLAWALGVMAIRHRSPLVWPVLGIVVLVLLGAAVRIGLTLPSPTTHGEVSFSGSFSTAPAGLIGLAGQLGLAFAPYAALLYWRAAKAREAA